MTKPKDKLDNINITRECVRKEICDANIYYNLLFIWINGIRINKVFYKDFSGMFDYIEEALVTKYIFALTKIFAMSRESGLWKLIVRAKAVPERFVKLKVEREPVFIHKALRKQRKEFFRDCDKYVNKIKAIKLRLTALRNKQRAHSLPFMPDGQKVIWAETKEWLTFAEKTFFCIMGAICESSSSPGQFVPEELNAQMKYFASIIEGIDSKQ